MIQFFENMIKLTANHIIIPESAENTFRQFISKKNIHVFHGYKEDIYLADYKPDNRVKDIIPYDHFIVIRPEALSSFYVHGKETIVPELLHFFLDNDINIVYLPREKHERELVKKFEVFIPETPLNGLDLCYFSDAVLTGSGTMGREAACMGKPAVSFFPSNNFLSVDEQLIDAGKLLHSRNVDEIGNYVLRSKNDNKLINFNCSKKVKEEILEVIRSILS